MSADSARRSGRHQDRDTANDLLECAIGREAEHLRYVLLLQEDEDMEVMGRDPDNRFAVGGTIGSTALGSGLGRRG
ncbi:MAG: hypothetical protein AVDCRST_MAG12-3496 [uncultured Rubrobacteraceae bacterium]|uniref:Uncharacterized protein n=1 Tax=uncultured Rubrobacteraceae bacterium TaxID=349277 RepID=A0A6J4T8J7_9ACTN|nr:MAG: hypothetical protein AVDCRST_MAG12-3496 [uncultured Rubrobacteraceae bacterium]